MGSTLRGSVAAPEGSRVVTTEVAFAGGTITGTVVSPAEEPVADAAIMVTTPSGANSTVQTNEKGEFTAEVPAGGGNRFVEVMVAGIEQISQMRVVSALPNTIATRPPSFVEPGKKVSLSGNYPEVVLRTPTTETALGTDPIAITSAEGEPIAVARSPETALAERTTPTALGTDPTVTGGDPIAVAGGQGETVAVGRTTETAAREQTTSVVAQGVQPEAAVAGGTAVERPSDVTLGASQVEQAAENDSARLNRLLDQYPGENQNLTGGDPIAVAGGQGETVAVGRTTETAAREQTTSVVVQGVQPEAAVAGGTAVERPSDVTLGASQVEQAAEMIERSLPVGRAVSADGMQAITSYEIPNDFESYRTQTVLKDAYGNEQEFSTNVFKIVSASIDQQTLASGQNARFEYVFDFGPGPEREVLLTINTGGAIKYKKSGQTQRLQVDSDGRATFVDTVTATKGTPAGAPFSIDVVIAEAQ